MVKIGLIQLDIAWEDVAANVAKAQALSAHGHGYDLLVLPELWSVGFTMNQEAHKANETTVDAMIRMSQVTGAAVLGGVPAKTATGQHNRAYLVKDGAVVGHYSKNKTFTYAGEHLKYEAGQGVKTWPLAGFNMTPLVCYDLRFPELARACMPQTTLLVYIANWPSTRIAHWQALLVARAIENQCYTIGVNRVGLDAKGLVYTGSSMVVDPAGALLLQTEPVEGLFTVDINPARVDEVRSTFPFLKDMQS